MIVRGGNSFSFELFEHRLHGIESSSAKRDKLGLLGRRIILRHLKRPSLGFRQQTIAVHAEAVVTLKKAQWFCL